MIGTVSDAHAHERVCHIYASPQFSLKGPYRYTMELPVEPSSAYGEVALLRIYASRRVFGRCSD